MKTHQRPQNATQDPDGWVSALTGLQLALRHIRHAVVQAATPEVGSAPPPTDAARRLVHALLGAVALSRDVDQIVSRWAQNEAEREPPVVPVNHLLR